MHSLTLAPSKMKFHLSFMENYFSFFLQFLTLLPHMNNSPKLSMMRMYFLFYNFMRSIASEFVLT